MTSARQPVLRNLLDCRRVRPLNGVQRRWAKVHDVRFVATHQPPAQDRYKQKLEQKAAEEGHSTVSSLKDAYQDKIQAVRDAESSRADVPPSSESPSFPQQQQQQQQQQQSTASTTSHPSPKQQQQPTTAVPGIKPLSSYLDLEKVRSLPAKEIEALWRLRHVNDPRSICATIPLETYTRIANTARQHPQFILPLPREVPVQKPEQPQPQQQQAGQSPNQSNDSSSSSSSSLPDTTTAAEMHFLQWGFHPPASPDSASASASASASSSANTHSSTVIFTHLAQYKLHGAYSEPHTLLTHHLDLADSSGLVLMNGRVVPDRGVSASEAKLLSLWLQRFYDWGAEGEQGGGKKGEILRGFTAGDAERFKVEELVEEVEKV